jgi:DNA polymerase-3 subunit delta'
MFRQIKGQDKAISLLVNAIKHNRIAQAYIFHGPEGVGKFTTALYFGMALNCLAISEKRPCGVCNSCHKFLEFSHPDLTYIFPTPNIKLTGDNELKAQSINEQQAYIDNRKQAPWEKFYFSGSTEIRRESITLLQKKFEYSQIENKYRVCIIEEADEMNPNTANSFLKTLEEPPVNTVLILLTTKYQSMLPTIISRCQAVFFKPLSYKTIENLLVDSFNVDKPTAKTYSRIANGNLEQALRLANDTKHEAKSLMLSFIEAALKEDDIYVINMVSSSKEKIKSVLVHDLLYHIALFYNDLALLKAGYKEVNSLDLMELLETCSSRVRNWDSSLLKGLTYFDDLHRKLDGNVNVQYVLINLYHHLKDTFNLR